MTVTILAFGISKEIIGKSKIKLTTEKSTSVMELKKILISMYPGLSQLPDFLIAINSKYSSGLIKLHPNDEIAIIPPTNGG